MWLDIIIKKKTTEFTIHFKKIESFDTNFIIDKIEELRLECEEKYNTVLNNSFIQTECLYV